MLNTEKFRRHRSPKLCNIGPIMECKKAVTPMNKMKVVVNPNFKNMSE